MSSEPRTSCDVEVELPRSLLLSSTPAMWTATGKFCSVALSHLKVETSYVETRTSSDAVIRGVKLEAEPRTPTTHAMSLWRRCADKVSRSKR